MPEQRKQEGQKSKKDIRKDLRNIIKEMEILVSDPDWEVKNPPSENEMGKWRFVIMEAKQLLESTSSTPATRGFFEQAKNTFNSIIEILENKGTAGGNETNDANADNAEDHLEADDKEEGDLQKKAEEEKSDLRIKLELAIEAMKELTAKPDSIDNFTEEELNTWKAIVNEAQDLEDQLTKKTEELMHEADELAAFLGDVRRTRDNLAEAIQKAEEIFKRADKPRASEQEIEKLLKVLNKTQDRRRLLSKEGIDLMYQLSELLSDLRSDREKAATRPKRGPENADYAPEDWRSILGKILRANQELNKEKIRTGKYKIKRKDFDILNTAKNPEEYAAHGITGDPPNAQEIKDINSIIDAVNEYSAHVSPDKFPIAKDSDSAETGTAPKNEAGINSNEEGNETETEKKDAGNYSVLRMHNRIKLKKLLKDRFPEEADNNLDQEVEREGEFVKVSTVESLFSESDKEALLEGLLFADEGTPEYGEAIKMIVATLRDSGLLLGVETEEEARQIAKELILKQRNKLSDLADVELNKDAASKFSWKKLGLKTSLMVGLGYAAAFSGGVPGIMALAAGRIGISYLENIRRERKKKTLIKEKQDELQTDHGKAENFLKGFFADIAISKQKQINEVPWMGPDGETIYEQFFFANEEIFNEYSEDERYNLIHSLVALDEINEIHNQREESVFEKISGLAKKKVELVAEVSNFFENSRFIQLGKDISPEAKAVSAAAWSAASIMARSVPGVRNVFLAMAGWKAGNIAGGLLNRKFGLATETQNKEIGFEDRAEDVLRKLEELNQERRKSKLKKKLSAGINITTKISGALLGALLPELISELTGGNEAGAETPATSEAIDTTSDETVGGAAAVSGGAASGTAEQIIRPGEKSYDFEGIPGVSSGMPTEGTYDTPGGGGIGEGGVGEDVLSEKVARAGMDGGSGSEIPKDDMRDIIDNAGEAEELAGEAGNAGGSGKNPFAELEKTPGWDGGRSGTGETAPTLDSLSEKMSQVDGKNAKHLWGLIEDKAEAAIGDSYGDLKDSEGRMTYIVDAIKDRIGDDPEKFGLPKGTNIDVLSKEQLLKLASSDEFDSQLAQLLTDEKHGLIEAAKSLDESAVRSIEGNNEFYRQNVSKLDTSGGLGQEDYDLMDKMRSGGSEAAEESSAASAATIKEATAGTSETLKDAADRTTETISGYAPTSTETILSPLNIDLSEKGSQAWVDLMDKLKTSNDRSDITKSLENVFRQTDIEEIYDKEFHSPFYVQGVRKITDYLGGRDLLLFETPYPADAENSNALGPVKFEYDSVTNKLRAFHGGKYFGENFSDRIPLTKKLELIIEDIKLSEK